MMCMVATGRSWAKKGELSSAKNCFVSVQSTGQNTKNWTKQNFFFKTEPKSETNQQV